MTTINNVAQCKAVIANVSWFGIIAFMKYILYFNPQKVLTLVEEISCLRKSLRSLKRLHKLERQTVNLSTEDFEEFVKKVNDAQRSVEERNVKVLDQKVILYPKDDQVEVCITISDYNKKLNDQATEGYK